MRRRLGLALFLPIGLALFAAPLLAQSPPATDSLCLAGIRLNGGVVQRLACVRIPRDTTIKVDTLIRRDTVPVPSKPDTIPLRVDTIPLRVDTIPLKRDTVWLPLRVDTLWLPRPTDSTSTPTPTDTATPPDTTSPPVPPPSSGVAELPRDIPVVPAGLDTLPCSVTLSSGLQPALNSARGSTVICLTGTHRGNFTVPACSGSGWTVVRSAWPAPIGRMQPSRFNGARLVSPNNFAALTFKARACRVLLLGLEVTSDSALTNGPNPLIAIGTAQENTLADLPTDIAIDRVWCHGWAHQNVRRCVTGNGARMSLTRSWCEEIHEHGTDSQCWISWNGAGPILIADNTLSAASEVIMFGGGDPRVPGLIATDITIVGNHVWKPAFWKNLGWNVKNLIETKSSKRVRIEGNVLEGNYFDEQPGHAAFVLKSTNQSGGCRWCMTADWTIRRNLIRNVGAFASIAGRADSDTSRLTDSTVSRLYIGENWIDSVSVAPWTNQNRPLLIFTTDNRHVTLERNTVAGAGPTLEASIMFNATQYPAVTDLTLRGNIFPRGRYGMFATSTGEGLASWTKAVAGVFTWDGNAFLGSTSAKYPATTTWHTSLSTALGVAGVARATVDAGIRGVVVTR